MINASLTDLFLLFIGIIVAVGMHEAMHGFTAYWLGDPTAQEAGRLTLNPLRHIDLFTTVLLPLFLILAGLPPFFVAKPVPFNPYRVRYHEFGAALIGVAGPLTNLTLAALTALVLRGFGANLASGIVKPLMLFVQINVAFFVFNMIPFPPLDGSRLLYAFAPEPLQKIMYRIETGGLLTIVLFMFLLFPVLAPAIVFINERLVHLLLPVLGV